MIDDLIQILNGKNPDTLPQGLRGDQSFLCQTLRLGKELGRLLAPLTKFRESPPNRLAFPFPPHVLDGFIATLSAAATTGEKPVAKRRQVAEAIAAFDRAWGESISCDDESKDGPDDCYGYSGEKSLGFWVVMDLLERWSRNSAHQSPLTARTPILVCDNKGLEGYLLYLTVELFPCKNGGPLCPDPLYLGLTDINTRNGSFVQALQAVWTKTKVAQRYRGRWRLENPKDEEVLRRVSDRIEYPPSIAGQSAQAAMLCAILAASGDPYGSHGADEATSEQDKESHEALEKPVAMSEPLDPFIVISAEVEESGVEAIDLKVKSVGGVGSKLREAELRLQAGKQLDTVLLARKPTPATATEADKIEEDARMNVKDLKVQPVSSIREALDIMLLTNQYVRSYKAAVEEDWLKLWDPEDSGRYPQPEKVQ